MSSGRSSGRPGPDMRRLVPVALLLLSACQSATRTYQGESRLDILEMQSGQRMHAQARECGLTFKGSFTHLLLKGNDNHVTLTGRVELLEIEGQNNQVDCQRPPGSINLRGSANRVKVAEVPGTSKPKVNVEGNYQAIQFYPVAK